MRRFLTILLAACTLSATARASHAAKNEPAMTPGLIAVLPFQQARRPVTAEELKVFEQRVVATSTGLLSPLPLFRVLGARGRLDEDDFDPEEPCTGPCAVRAAKSLRAPVYVTGVVGHAGDGFVAFLTLFSPEGRQAALQLRGHTTDALALAFENKARLFLGRGLGLLAEEDDDRAHSDAAAATEEGGDEALAKIDPDLQRTQCDDGDGNACTVLAWRYEAGKGLKIDTDHAETLYGRGCQLGNSTACFNLGVRNLTDKDPPDPERAADLFKTGCDRDHADCCAVLGILTNEGSGVPKKASRAVALFQKACDHDSSLGCTALGRMHARGEGVRKNPARAAELFDKACDDGYSPACDELGDLYRTGKGVQRDLAHAAELYENACDDGTADSCVSLAGLYAQGQGVPKDAAKARALMSKACEEGADQACGDSE